MSSKLKDCYKSKSKISQSCSTLCGPMDCSLPDSSVHGIFQARIVEWVAISNSRGSSQPETEPTSLVSPALTGRLFTTELPGKPVMMNNGVITDGGFLKMLNSN